MSKDVIYVDASADITDIISKIKLSESEIIALVPPKKNAVLQSSVNLRLLKRSAVSNDKKLVLVTNVEVLKKMSLLAGIPVSKSVNEAPMLPSDLPIEKSEPNMVIEGDKLDNPAVDSVVESIEASEGIKDEVKSNNSLNNKETAKKSANKDRKKSKHTSGLVSVPDFSKFRKRLLLVLVGVLLIAGGLVWALVFAPKATVFVDMKTEDSEVSQNIVIASGQTTSSETGVISGDLLETTKEYSFEFNATGQKEVGEKAKGVVKISHTSIKRSATSIPKDTIVRSNSGLAYLTTKTVSVPATDPWSFIENSQNMGSVDVGVVAAEIGDQYNTANGAAKISVSNVRVNFTESTSGGSSETVTILEQSDINNALNSLKSEIKTDELLAELKSQKSDDPNYIFIDASVRGGEVYEKSIAYSDNSSILKAGDKVTDDKILKLSAKVDYSIYGVSKTEVDNYLNQSLSEKLNKDGTQKVYSTGVDTVNFENVNVANDAMSATFLTDAKVGPSMTEDEVFESIKDMKSGEARQLLESRNGVESVDVRYSYFWVNKIPQDKNKVEIRFKIDGEEI